MSTRGNPRQSSTCIGVHGKYNSIYYIVGWLRCHPDVHPSDGLGEDSSEGNCRLEELRPLQVLDWMHLNMFDPNFSCTGK